MARARDNEPPRSRRRAAPRGLALLLLVLAVCALAFASVLILRSTNKVAAEPAASLEAGPIAGPIPRADVAPSTSPSHREPSSMPVRRSVEAPVTSPHRENRARDRDARPVATSELLVLDGVSGAPLAGAQVRWAACEDLLRLHREHPELPGNSAEEVVRVAGWPAVTDLDGIAEIGTDLDEGCVHVGWGGMERFKFLRGRQGRGRDGVRPRFELSLFPERTLEVLVVDGHSVPQPGITVSLRLGTPTQALHLATARSDGDGIASFEGFDRKCGTWFERRRAMSSGIEDPLCLPLGPDERLFVAPSPQTEPAVHADVDPSPGPLPAVRLVLPDSGSLVVRLVDETGAPAEGASLVELRTVEELVDEETVRGIPPSSWLHEDTGTRGRLLLGYPVRPDGLIWNGQLEQGHARIAPLGLEHAYTLKVTGRRGRVLFEGAVDGPTRVRREVTVDVLAPPPPPTAVTRISNADGKPFSSAWIIVTEKLERLAGTPGRSSTRSMRTDPQGILQWTLCDGLERGERCTLSFELAPARPGGPVSEPIELVGPQWRPTVLLGDVPMAPPEKNAPR